MTRISTTVPAQTSSFNSVLISVLTGAVIVLAGVLSFAPYMV
ncbi:MAG TPA: hypothetical protein VHU87_09870 [Rhizomicrobium sp.]|jgi:hypothetical protein|nr:hypothetical protein [Rhizomicrobium sp.]